MGLDQDKENTPLRLSLFSLPRQSAEPSGTLTPPLLTSASVPFLWEEAPGKPRSYVDETTAPKAARTLDLPPRLAKITQTPSLVPVLEGPYELPREGKGLVGRKVDVESEKRGFGSWRGETVKENSEEYSTILERRHHLEINDFSEQLRLKDEKLEDFCWRLLSMELESERLNTHIVVLKHDVSQLQQENMKLGTQILEKEAEVKSLKHLLALKLELQNQQLDNSNVVSQNLVSNSETMWSNVMIIKNNKPRENEEEEKTTAKSFETSQKVKPGEEEENSITSQTKDIVLHVQSREKDFVLDPDSIKDVVEIVERPSLGQILSKDSVAPWKMDLQALRVSYKIKRLEQQLIMLEKFTGKQKTDEYSEHGDNGKTGMKGFHLLMTLLSKQITRYQSLQEKIDDLCKRMHENELETSPGDGRITRSKKKTKTLANYLVETFQLQRYIVASGQRLMELQSKIVSVFDQAADGLNGPGSCDMKRCGDSMGSIFKEVQRGLEVRIARIIGDVESTLACDIIHLRR